MMDPLNQVVEEEKRLRVKMRQTNAVVNQLDRWQRGRSAKPWRSGHHWDSPHPEVPLNIGKEFRWMSSTPSEYANMVRQNEMEMNYEGGLDAEFMDNFDNNPMMMDTVNSGDISEDEMYRVFNMGIGLILVSEEPLPESEDYYLLSRVENTTSGVTVV